MAGSKSEYFSDAVLDVLLGTNLTAGSYYVALYTVSPTETSSAETSELTDSQYSRVALPAMTGPEAGAGSVRKISNTAELVMFTGADGGETVAAWGVVDSASGAGNVIYWSDDPTEVISAGNDVKIAAGALIIQED